MYQELRAYNEELLHKKMLIAISKSDMLDEELKTEIAKELPKELPLLFISSTTNTGLTQLKDKLWELLNEEDNKL